MFILLGALTPVLCATYEEWEEEAYLTTMEVIVGVGTFMLDTHGEEARRRTPALRAGTTLTTCLNICMEWVKEREEKEEVMWGKKGC